MSNIQSDTNQSGEQLLATEIANLVIEPVPIPPGTKPSHEYLYGHKGRDALAERLLPLVLRFSEPLQKELAELKAVLADSNAVHVNILRGTIPLTREQALHIAGATDYDDLQKRITEVEELRRDKERLDWLCSNHDYYTSVDGEDVWKFKTPSDVVGPLRYLIDAAMQTEKEGK